MTITVYTTSSCVQCTATKKKLNQLGIRYTEIPVTNQIAEELPDQWIYWPPSRGN